MIIYSSTDAWESETGWLVEKSEYDNLAAELAAANARADAAEQATKHLYSEAQNSFEDARRQLAEAQAELARVRAALEKIDGVVVELAKNAGDEVTQQNILLVTSIAAIRVLVSKALAAPQSEPVKE